MTDNYTKRRGINPCKFQLNLLQSLLTIQLVDRACSAYNQKTSPDVACLQELKAMDEKFPLLAVNQVGCNAVWHGQKAWNGVAVLAKNNLELNEVGRGLAGDPNDEQCRYIEARVNDVLVGCLYLPNGNPDPGPKFDYKMAWMERLLEKGRQLVNLKEPVVLLGDYNVIPTDLDAYKPERWVNDAVFFSETKDAYQRLLQPGLD